MKRHLRFIVYIALVFGLLAVFTRLLESPEGEVLSELEFTTYDNVLYTPEELHALTPEQQAAGHIGWDYDYHDKEFSRVRTNIIRLGLTPGKTYGLYTEQLTYASKLWIDGEMMVSMGQVADSAAQTIHRTGPAVVYFTADEETEIVMQRCNFMHAKWNAVRFFLGPQEVITRQVQALFFRVTLTLVILITLGLINVGMFVGMPERKRFLWFSLMSLTSAVHIAAMDPKVIMILLPWLSGEASYRTEGCCLILTLFFLMLFLGDCFGRSFARWADLTGWILMGALFLVFVFVPTIVYTRVSVEMAVAFAGYGVFYCIIVLVRVFRARKELTISQWYLLGGIGIYTLSSVMVILGVGPVHTNQLEIGLLLFELVTTIALAMEFSEVRQAYTRSRRNEEQLRQMNASMAKSQELQENFLALMNHEMRTPLTVIAGYADLSARQLESSDPPDEEVVRNLRLIKQEALRLGRIVEQSEEGSRSAVAAEATEEAEVLPILRDVQDFCRPICEKRGSRIEIDCPDGLSLCCMRDSLLQALYNLVINASRHTDDGVILLEGSKDEDRVILRVTDDGEGMDEETIARAFERGYTRDGRRGLGLALCREIAEWHGGSIRIDRNPGRGITVSMSLPSGGPGRPAGTEETSAELSE